MKRIKFLGSLCCFLLFLFATSYLQAQAFMGISAGSNLAKWHSSAEISPSFTHPGLEIGLPIEISLSSVFSLHLEPMFIQKGSNFKEYDPLLTGSMVLNYLELPAFAKLKLGRESSIVRPHLVLGPSLGVALGGKSTATALGFTEEYAVNFERDEINRLDVGLNIGTGLDFKIGNGKLFLDGRYQLGLTNLVLNGNGDYVHNRGIQIEVGYLMPLFR